MKRAFSEAQDSIAGGYNSPFRSFDSVGGTPVFMESGKGSSIKDIEGKKYIDYSLGWGPMILGHAHKSTRAAVSAVSKNGWCFGTPTEAETRFAQKIREMYPSMEKIRLTNSGTEAVMGAIRLARGYTKKDKIIIFDGGYHGHSNETRAKLNSQGKAELTSTGIPQAILDSTLVARYNDIESVTKLISLNSDIAAILVEPIASNMGLVLPTDDFLKELRGICDTHGIVLIFDEVVTGFRASLGGAQGLYNIRPDVTVLGKALAGGFAVGAFGGKKEIMDKLSPTGDVYSAGTFSGNPLVTYAGIATIEELQKEGTIGQLELNTRKLCEELNEFIQKRKSPVIITHTGSMFSVFFTEQKRPRNYDDVKKCDSSIFSKYFHFLLNNGIYVSPSSEDTSFLSTAHTEKDLSRTIRVIKKFLATL